MEAVTVRFIDRVVRYLDVTGEIATHRGIVEILVDRLGVAGPGKGLGAALQFETSLAHVGNSIAEAQDPRVDVVHYLRVKREIAGQLRLQIGVERRVDGRRWRR